MAAACTYRHRPSATATDPPQPPANMRFKHSHWERRFLLSFNHSCIRADIIYSLCLFVLALRGGTPRQC